MTDLTKEKKIAEAVEVGLGVGASVAQVAETVAGDGGGQSVAVAGGGGRPEGGGRWRATKGSGGQQHRTDARQKPIEGAAGGGDHGPPAATKTRYVGLNMLMKVVTADVQAVQRHRATILKCIKDSDVSIRRRALELVCILVNETNVKALTKELVDYLEVSDPDFRVLSLLIIIIIRNIINFFSGYSSEKIWYIDQMLKVLSEAGNYVKDEVWHALIVVISNASELHGYTVRALYKAFQRSAEQETLVRVAVWCIGEYGEFLINNDGMLDVEDPITVRGSDDPVYLWRLVGFTGARRMCVTMCDNSDEDATFGIVITGVGHNFLAHH
ncbi:hypothetical protein V8G54_001428 [Vigna mungo]|uniref:Clathrin/coatomer adaptor adaptin-like N-terminal domain-containing protein n=1 Tax=Vigna mungo TaxID=3915 RepID=A0AAQ3S877_VIGMU